MLFEIKRLTVFSASSFLLECQTKKLKNVTISLTFNSTHTPFTCKRALVLLSPIQTHCRNFLFIYFFILRDNAAGSNGSLLSYYYYYYYYYCTLKLVYTC